MKGKNIFKAVTLLFLFLSVIIPSIFYAFAEEEQVVEQNISSNMQQTSESNASDAGCAIIPSTSEQQEVSNLNTENLTEQSENTVIDEVSTRELALGNSSISGTRSNGACNQDIITINYSYSLLLSLAINDIPVIAIQLPEELASQINSNPTKQTAFLKSLTGTVTYPLNVLANQSFNIQATNSNVAMTYDAAKSAILFTFPKSTLTLSLLNSWNVNLNFDPVTLYKNGITIPPATNGQNYTIRGNILSNNGLIDFTTGNAKTGSIALKSISLGTCPVLTVTPPTLSGPFLHNTNQVNGTINQAQNSGYNYTAEITTKTTQGVTAVYANVPVNAAGNFTLATSTSLEYGDQITAKVRATSKTNTDIYESQSGTASTVTWPLGIPTINNLNAGATTISGAAIQTVTGTYRAVVAINNNPSTTYTVSVDQLGQYQVSNLTALKGGDTVQVTINGYSSRDGSVLVSTAPVTTTVPYTTPVLNLNQQVFRKNGNDNWENAPNAVTGQMVKYVSTVTMQNTNAIWNNQAIVNQIPAGLTQLTDIGIYKIKADGTSQLIGVPQLIADSSSPSGTSLSYQTTNQAYALLNQNEALQFQYTGTITSISPPTSLVNKITFSGQNGGGQAVTPLSNTSTIAVSDGTLKLVTVPTSFGFQNTTVPTSQKIYNRTTTSSNLTIYDGRVKKTKWSLYVREVKPLTAGITQIPGAIIYSLNGQDQVVNAQNMLIYSQTSPDNNPFVIPWEITDGIRLRISPGPNVKSNQSYQGQLEWNLTDAPL